MTKLTKNTDKEYLKIEKLIKQFNSLSLSGKRKFLNIVDNLNQYNNHD